MAFYQRDIKKQIEEFKKYPVIAFIGPRQSGKTTLTKSLFSDYVFLDLDDLELRAFALSDPKSFFRTYQDAPGIIIDEFQNAPELLSYIKVIVDAHDRPGYFILTGSQNFLVNQEITQSLAGRVGIIELLPLSLHELKNNNLLPENAGPEVPIFNGSYPRLYNQEFTPLQFYPSYIHTYVERDVRQLVNIKDVTLFQKFMKLCAARIGQLLNLTDLATACGISVATVQAWLSILETSYIIFQLHPHWTNFNKRMTKSTKLYFYDTGLACSLLELSSPQAVLINHYYGNLFENFIIADFYKQAFNAGLSNSFYFWRDQNGTLEVDCLIEHNAQLIPLEIKSSETFNEHFFDGLKKWCNLDPNNRSTLYVVYAGTLNSTDNQQSLVSWQQSVELIKKIKN